MKRVLGLLLALTLLVGCTSTPVPSAQHMTDAEKSETSKDTWVDDNKESDLNGQPAKEYAEDVLDDTSGKCEIHFIDIGQGDCTLIKCNGEAMLIDTGTYDNGTKVQLYLQKEGVDSLKYFIATHPDADHIGSAGVIINKFPIDNLFMPNVSKDTKAYEYMVKAIEYKNIKPINPSIGNTYDLGGATFTILNPGIREYEDINDYSIAIMLKFGLIKVLLIGDCEKASEREMLNGGINLDADILKAGHHGSSTSADEDFINAVSPAATIISCGANNDYGHPHA